jgi:diacylglycerol kinase
MPNNPNKPKFVKYNPLKSVWFAFTGVKTVYSRELNVWFQLTLGVVMVLISVYFKNNLFAAIHFVLALLTISQEIMNTALEELCDLIDMNYNLTIKRVKDISAGSVLVSALAWLFVIIFHIVLLITKAKLNF